MLHKALRDLKKYVCFKADTSPGDIVLVGLPTGILYGYVQSIEKNIKKGWFNIYLKLLTVPPADVSWILRTPQMNGEIFTIQDEDHFLIAVDMSRNGDSPDGGPPEKPESGRPGLKLIKN